MVPASCVQPKFSCIKCNREYKYKRDLSRHVRIECGKEPRHQCPFCPLRTKHKGNLKAHIYNKHSMVLTS